MNQIQVRSMETHATLKAGDLLRILFRRSWCIALFLGASISIAWFVSKRTPKAWKATGQIIVINRLPGNSGNSSGPSPSALLETTETQTGLIQSYTMARRTIDWLKNDALSKGRPTDSVKIDVPTLQRAITANAWRDTNLIDISVEAESPERAVELTNAVCQAFVLWKRETAQQNLQDTLMTLERRTLRAKENMIIAEKLETAYKNKHKLVDPTAQQSAMLQQYARQDMEVKNLKQEVIALEAKLRGIGSQLANVTDAIRKGEGLRNDSEVLQLQSKLNAAEMEKAEALLRFTPDYPGMSDYDKRIADLKDRLAKAVESTLDNKRPSLESQGSLFTEYKQVQTTLLFTRARLQTAIELRRQQEKQMAGVPNTSMEYARLAREAELARNLHSQLQSALNVARIDKDMAASNVQISQFAYASDDPIRPNTTRDLAFGGIIGLFLSLISVLLLEQSDRRVRNVDSVRRLASGPVIGAMPRLTRRQLQDMIEGDAPPHAIEACGLACANLSLVARNGHKLDPWKQQILLITSALPGEGKSVIASQIARTFARTGRRVILVDADMRRASQNKMFNMDEPHGFAELLAGERRLDEVLVSVDEENLLVLPSGSPNQSPTDLIALPDTPKILDMLKAEADIVILDTPACSVVADALFLAPYADSIMFVVGIGQVDEDVVRSAAEALQSANAKTMVYFVNRTPQENKKYASYYYYGNGKNGRNRGDEPEMKQLPPVLDNPQS